MSDSRSPGPPSSEVVRNSALLFVACAQPAEGNSSQDSRDLGQAERQVPAGLKALCDAYSRLYPDQVNPLQVTTRLKYWLGGHDPLDYISMYWNAGKPEENIPPHWHYVSFGLSDLHGDGRVHAPPDRVLVAAGAESPSGFGFELTFRLEAPAPPPLWPAALLQALARYLFATGNKFVPGDHISWHAPLDGRAQSRVRHLLVAADPQLRPLATPHGTVTFIQVVGCTGRELRAAQRGSGLDVLSLMAEDPNSGGRWLVTCPRRRRSCPRARRPPPPDPRAPRRPAPLAGVSARLRWEPWTPSPEEHSSPLLSPSVERQIKETLQRGLSTMSTDRTGQEGHTGMSTDSFEMSSIERALPEIPEMMQGSWHEECVEYLEGVHLVLSREAGALLPLAARARLALGAHFTWRHAAGGAGATLAAPQVAGAFATPDRPYARRGLWLQMMIPNELIQDMSNKVMNLSKLAETDSESDSEGEEKIQPPTLPVTYSWPKYRLKISVVPDNELL